jgi:DHA2 family metal-tetracycline-proton antiporter-like MFS transporter
MLMSRVKASEAPNTRALVPWIAYLIFFAVLNETMFNVSTPMIAAQFSLTPSGVSWMMTVFMVFFGVGSVTFGKLADIYSLRDLIRAGVGLYAAASVLGFALRSTYPGVLAARALQGAGGSAIPALVFVAIARHFEESERGRIFGLITSVVSLAIGFGPVLGGFVASASDWAYLFLIPTPILIALPFIARILPRESRRSGGVDALGAALSALVVGSLVAFLNFGSLAYLAAFAVLLALFIARIRTAVDPFIKPSLFANVAFRESLVATFCLFAIVLGMIFLVPLMLSAVHGLAPSRIGLVLFPGAFSSIAAGPFAGRLVDRRGSGFVILAGLSLLAAGMAELAFFLALSPYIVAFSMLLAYVGFAFFQTAMVSAISRTLSPEETGMGMGLFNLVGVLSGAIGTALVGRALGGKWLDFAFLPFAASPKSFAYSNIALVFAILVMACAVAFFRPAKPIRASAIGEKLPDATCAEPSGC